MEAVARGTSETRAAHLLRLVRDDRLYAEEIEAAAMLNAQRWLREVTRADADVPTAAPGPVPPTWDTEWLGTLAVGGDGAPAVADADIAEFAGAVRMSNTAARRYLADASDLLWRLPRVAEALRTGRIPVWKARQVTAATHGLCADAARHVDAALAPQMASAGPTMIQRMVLEAEARFDPAAAEARAIAAAESRKVDAFPSARADGTVDVVATLDHGDAEDLEAAIALVAAELAASEQHAEAPLDVRRSQALGVIARRQLSGWTGTADETTSRVLHTYVHLRPGGPLARVEKADTLLPIRTVAAWCTKAGTQVVITPVLDLTTTLTRDGYVPSAPMREQAIVGNETCVHPYCTRPARTADLDHIRPYDKDGPPGQTTSTNLAPLCRLHHRLKTHAGWRYRPLDPGYFLWRSPGGQRHLRTPTGTISLDGAGP
ncbi:HNH endonuclease signature motif containing protein [Nocardioides sp.]|uniref:HNH endonuclease signature motif containing protein n=1 Tax=Nocardioides sp. TaxID=35761 RepID=UPI0026240174|nr:HNH endonuclease signature motif containing protein [Nocardioides sp.]